MFTISIVIPSYNSERTIRDCLSSLMNQVCTFKYDIYLVDSSNDATANIVRGEFTDVNFIHFDVKTDPGTARNSGVKASKGDIIAFIDSDCIADLDWIEKIGKLHLDGVDVVGGCVRNGNGEKDLIGLAGYIAEFRDYIPGRACGYVSHLPTCNISYRRKIFEEYGFFDSTFYPQEDLVFNHRLVMNGIKIYFDPQISIYHTHRSEFSSFLNHQKKIGFVCSTVLRQFDMEGSTIARTPLLASLLSPLLVITKFVRTVITFTKYQPDCIFKKPMVLIPFFVGLLFWISGFLKSSFDKQKNS
jgi:glycosyltransferase involved in cell wall biosynthesis